MKRLALVVYFVTLFFDALSLTACSSTSTVPSTGREHYAVSKDEKSRLEIRAAKGDRKAAIKLLEYHLLVTRDKTQIHRWRGRVKELTPASAN